MTRRKLAFAMLGLGLVFILLNAALDTFVGPALSHSRVQAFLTGGVATVPIVLGMFLISRTRRTLAKDEYQLMLLDRQALFAAGFALLSVVWVGFYDGHTVGAIRDSYSQGVFSWFVMWFICGFRQQPSE